MASNKQFSLNPFVLVAASALPASLAIAQGHAHHDAHVHGIVELTMAVEGDALELELESPAANIVGFEHKARTAEQIKAAENAKALLENPVKLFSFSGSQCAIQQSTVDMMAILADKHDSDGNHHDKEHHDDSHDKHGHHDKEHHDEEHHDGDDNHGDGDTHSEISASYRFKCSGTAGLNAVTVNLFQHFPAIEEIEVMWITASGQGGAELTGRSNTFSTR